VKLPRTFAGVWAVTIAGTLVLSAVLIALIAVFSGDGWGLVRQHLELGDVLGDVLGLLLITGMLSAAVHFKRHSDDNRDPR
jgi:hypothetical protein